MKHVEFQIFINGSWGPEYIETPCIRLATLMNMFKTDVVINYACSNHGFSMDSEAQNPLMKDVDFELFINALFWPHIILMFILMCLSSNDMLDLA